MDKAKGKQMKGTKPKKPYEKPQILTEEIREDLAVLACGKCETGPIQQFICQRFPSS